MTDDERGRDAFERSLDARLAEYAARAAGAPAPEAVDAAVQVGPRAVRSGTRASRWGLPRSRFAVLATVALVSTSFVAGLIAGRSLERDPSRQAGPSSVAELSPRPDATNREPRPPIVPSRLPTVFAMGEQIERWDPGFGGWSELVTAETGWVSPDGRLLAYDEGCDECWLMILDLVAPLDQQTPRRAFQRVPLTQFGGRPGFGPLAWAPDGRSIARMVNGTFEVVTMPVPGQAISTRDPLASRTTSLPHLATARRLEWSPDSQSLALVHEAGDLYVIDAASGEARQVTSGGPFRPKVEMVTPPLVWSPDGRSILSSDGDHAVVVDVDSGAIETLRERATSSEQLGWTPDGRVLVDAPLSMVVPVWRGRAGLTYPQNGLCHGFPAWSPTDGTEAYVIDGELHLQGPGLDARLGENLCGPGDTVHITWSPGGDWVAIEAEDPPGNASFQRYTVTLVSVNGERYDYVTDDRRLQHELRWVE